jgi:hypothetical protein
MDYSGHRREFILLTIFRIRLMFNDLIQYYYTLSVVNAICLGH